MRAAHERKEWVLGCWAQMGRAHEEEEDEEEEDGDLVS